MPAYYSKDGKWWWDGYRWQPVPQSPSTSWQVAKGILIALGIVILVLIAWWVITIPDRQYQDDQRWDWCMDQYEQHGGLSSGDASDGTLGRCYDTGVY